MKLKVVKSTGVVVEMDLDNLVPLLLQYFDTDQVALMISLLEYHFTEAVK